MERMPLVSVIVPVFNVEKYLGRCLDSLVGQTLRDIEILCVDDCSTDTSPSILQSYAVRDSRIRVISLPENRRQGGARNAGIREAKAPFVAFVDSDDWVDKGMFQELYSTAVEQGADWVCSDYYVYEGEGKVKRLQNGQSEWFNLPKDSRNKAFLLGHIRYVTGLFKRSLIVENDLFFPEHLLYEDNAVVTAIYLTSQKAVKVDTAFYYYRCDNTSTTRSTNNYHYFDRLETSKIFLGHMKRLGFYGKYKEEVDFRFVELFYVNTVMVALSQFHPPEKNYIRKVTEEVTHLCPHFRANRYFKERIPFRVRAVLYLISCNVHFGIAAYQVLKTLKH